MKGTRGPQRANLARPPAAPIANCPRARKSAALCVPLACARCAVWRRKDSVDPRRRAPGLGRTMYSGRSFGDFRFCRGDETVTRIMEARCWGLVDLGYAFMSGGFRFGGFVGYGDLGSG